MSDICQYFGLSSLPSKDVEVSQNVLVFYLALLLLSNDSVLSYSAQNRKWAAHGSSGTTWNNLYFALEEISWTNNHTKWSCKRRVERNAFHFFLSGAKRILPLPSVPEERERHHSVATMTNIQGSKEPNRKISLMRRSTRWTLLASDVEVMPICSLKGRYQVHCVVKGLIHLTCLFRAIFDGVKKEIPD